MNYRKRPLTIFLLLLIPIAAIAGYILYPRSWVEYVNKEGNFKILFPGQPEQSSRYDGGLKTNFTIYDMSGRGSKSATYVVTYYDCDDSLVNAAKKDSNQHVYENVLDHILQLGERRVVSERPVYFKHCKGWEVKLDYKKGIGLFTMRMYVIDHTFYMLQACCEASDNSGSTNKFLNSFELLH